MIVNVPTQKDFRDLIRFYKMLDYNVSLELSDWDVYEDQTCVNIESDKIDVYGKTVFYIQKGEPIYPFEVFKVNLIDGEIKGFPLEVVTAMLLQQKKQIGKTNLMAFIKQRACSKGGEGFDWVETRQGFDYWNSIIQNEEFEEFNYNKSIL
jgi:hypothetical protein